MASNVNISTQSYQNQFATLNDPKLGNFMYNPIKWIREPGDNETLRKVVAVFVAIVLVVTLVGIAFVFPGVQEWNRQTKILNQIKNDLPEVTNPELANKKPEDALPPEGVLPGETQKSQALNNPKTQSHNAQTVKTKKGCLNIYSQNYRIAIKLMKAGEALIQKSQTIIDKLKKENKEFEKINDAQNSLQKAIINTKAFYDAITSKNSSQKLEFKGINDKLKKCLNLLTEQIKAVDSSPSNVAKVQLKPTLSELLGVVPPEKVTTVKEFLSN